MEAIDFQRDSTFLNEMAAQYDACLKDPSKDTFNKVSAALHKIAKLHTGMHFNFHFVRCGGPNAFVIPPQADIASPMRPEELATKVQKFGRPVSEQELFKGVVNIKTGKVSGIYSEIPIDVFVATEFFTDREMTNITGHHIGAVALHEIGHGFTYLRYLGNFVLSNVVISEITRRQHEGADDKMIQEIVKVAEQKTGWRLRDLGEINRSTDPLVVQQVVMAGMVESIRSELNTKFYDRRAFEFSADQFVARHGGAKYIVEALDFMYRSYPMYFKEYRGRFANTMASLYGYLKVFAGAGAMYAGVVSIGLAAAGGGIPLILVGSFVVLTTLLADYDEGVYDPIPKRYEAMRRELISSSKDQNLSIKQRSEIIGQIEAIDVILRSLTTNSFFGPTLIGDFLLGIFTGHPAEQKFQRQLESLVNNRLFEISNKLQTV
jgi:hypothetical protein